MHGWPTCPNNVTLRGKLNRQDEVIALESEIDEVTANLWGINDAELKAIQRASADM